MDNYRKLLERKVAEDNANQMEQFLKERNLILTKTSDDSIDQNRVYSTSEICERLKIERHEVYKLIESGELLGKKKKSWKIPHASLEAYISRIMATK